MTEFDKQKRYFAASNSAEGFVNYFPQIFGGGRCRRLFVIKGGPGTGKSCFMRQVAKRAEACGYEVTYYYCSSDPDSLDGILIGGMGVGFVDGTAPHVWEPTAVGAFEQILNLGDFWNGDALAAQRGQIETLSASKSACYAEAYRYLSAYGSVLRALESAVERAVDTDKLSRAAARLIRKNVPSEGRGFAEEMAICDSIGMSGRVRFDTYEQMADKLYSVRDCCGTAYLFLEALYSHAMSFGLRVRVSRHPILPERIDALSLVDHGLTFVMGEKDAVDNAINMRRFIREDAYRGLRGYGKERMAVASMLMDCAEEAFARVRRHHFALEALFTDTMDFAAKEQFTDDFCTKIFGEA